MCCMISIVFGMMLLLYLIYIIIHEMIGKVKSIREDCYILFVGYVGKWIRFIILYLIYDILYFII